jgi:hypothetical protein
MKPRIAKGKIKTKQYSKKPMISILKATDGPGATVVSGNAELPVSSEKWNKNRLKAVTKQVDK